MPKICYVPKTFRSATQEVIDRANSIIAEYEAQGFDLTLRQLYYQFVARGIIANKDSEYDRLGSIINDARLAGQIDWNRIVDRTRQLRGLSHWDSPSQILRGAAYSYRTDKWKNQPYRVEIWIEKDALAGVFEEVCNRLDVPYFSCRGYTSQSEMWVASQRLLSYVKRGQTPVILHFGDHDPSGMDMTRDITDRLSLFADHHGYEAIQVARLALNWDQVQEHQPPPNPAKITDSRARAYIAEYGGESWELDAMEPAMLATLVEDQIFGLLDHDAWQEDLEAEQADKERLEALAKEWRNGN